MTVASTTRTTAARVIDRCRQIAACTEVPGEITRTFLSPPMHRVHSLLTEWMQAAGMTVRIDAAGNLRGTLPGPTAHSPRLIIGSHLDTVPNAGAFDGILGVVLGVAVVEAARGLNLPFAIEVIGFSEEEGVRFRKPFLGSLAAIGRLDAELLALTDRNGVAIAEAIRIFGLNPSEIPNAALVADSFAYLEFHIEQGPVLESENLPLGIVEAIAGQTRMTFVFAGHANHAGTTPMHLRSDALAAAAAWIGDVEAYATTHASSPPSARLKPFPAQATSLPATSPHRSTCAMPTTRLAPPPSARSSPQQNSPQPNAASNSQRKFSLNKLPSRWTRTSRVCLNPPHRNQRLKAAESSAARATTP
jgi:allantoate deiminase